MVFVDTEFAGEWSVRVRIPVYVTAIVCELQVEIGGSASMACVHVQGVQYIYRWYFRLYHYHAHCPSYRMLPWWHCLPHLFGKEFFKSFRTCSRNCLMIRRILFFLIIAIWFFSTNAGCIPLTKVVWMTAMENSQKMTSLSRVLIKQIQRKTNKIAQ